MRVKVREISEGMHPSEVVVQVKTADGAENLFVDRRSIDANGTLSVGFPVGRKGRLWAIELPQETMRGFWRVWVKASELVEESVEEAMA